MNKQAQAVTREPDVMTIEKPPVKYHVAEAEIAKERERCATLMCDTREGYEEVRTAIANLRTTRTTIEARRVELKRDALEYGRRVDSVAKHLTALIAEIERPLKAKKAAVDDERERKRREKEEAERAAVEAKVRAEREAEEAKLRAEREAEEERLRVIREAEEKRLAEQRAEREAEERRLAVERAALEAERAEAARKAQAEREAIERERREAEGKARAEESRVAALRAKQEREEAERQARIKAEQEAKERAERERVEAEERARQEAERKAAHERRMAALKPDADKLAAYAAALLAVEAPEMATEDGARALDAASNELQALCDGLAQELAAKEG